MMSPTQKSPVVRSLEAAMLGLLALALLYPIPAMVLEWGHLVNVFQGYGFVPGLLVLSAGMGYLSYLTARIARDAITGRAH